IGVLHQSIRHNRIGMANHAPRRIGGVANVATLSEDALAVADIRHTDRNILRRRSHRARKHKCSDKELQDDARRRVKMRAHTNLDSELSPLKGSPRSKM